MSKKWSVFILSLAVVALIGLFFYPQGVEWYGGLTESQQHVVYDRVIGGIFFGVMLGAICSVFNGIFPGLLFGLLFGLGTGVMLDGSNGLALASYSIGFSLSFCIIFFFLYLRTETKKSRLIKRAS